MTRYCGSTVWKFGVGAATLVWLQFVAMLAIAQHATPIRIGGQSPPNFEYVYRNYAIEPGKYADFVEWEEDLLNIEPA